MSDLTGARLLVRQLLAEGVTHVYGNPGTTEQAFVREVAATPELTYVLALQEAVAVGIADGAARMAGAPAFVQLHAAAGVGNALGMVYSAQVGRAPLVIYAGEPRTDQSELEPILYGRPASLSAGFTKWSVRVDEPGQISPVFQRAFKVAAEPPTGVVLVSVPSDVMEAVVPAAPPAATARIDWHGGPRREVADAIAADLASATAPLILCGDGVARAGSGHAVLALAERVGAAVMDAASSELTVPTTASCYLGSLNMLSDRSVARDLAPYDVILALGASLFPLINVSGAEILRSDQRLLQIDPDGWELGKNLPADLLVRAGITATLEEVSSALGARTPAAADADAVAARNSAVAETGRQRRTSVVEAQSARPQSGEGLSPVALATTLAEVLPSSVVLVDESVSTTGIIQQIVPRTEARTVFRARGGGLGQGLPNAVGVSLAGGAAPVVAVVGDGASMYTIQSLWTAARHHLPITFLICNNGAYHILKKNMQYFQGGGAADPGLPYDLAGPSVDLPAVAAGFGVDAAVVDTAEGLAKALAVSLARTGPTLLDVRMTTPR